MNETNLSESYPQYIKTPAKVQMLPTCMLPDCTKTCQNYVPKADQKLAFGRVWWNGLWDANRAAEPQEVDYVNNNGETIQPCKIRLDNGSTEWVSAKNLSPLSISLPELKCKVGDPVLYRGEECVIDKIVGEHRPYRIVDKQGKFMGWFDETNLSPLPVPQATDWQANDLVWDNSINGLVRLLPLGIYQCLANFSIPTPEQLLVEYKGHKCLAWEEKNGQVKVRYGVHRLGYARYDNYENGDDRFLVPDCLVVVSYNQMLRHYPNGIEYPKE
jgi:hypothetical protein